MERGAVRDGPGGRGKAGARWKAAGRRAAKRIQPPSALDDWPDVTGLDDEEAARVMGEYLYWLDYADRNEDLATRKKKGLR